MSRGTVSQKQSDEVEVRTRGKTRQCCQDEINRYSKKDRYKCKVAPENFSRGYQAVCVD